MDVNSQAHLRNVAQVAGVQLAGQLTHDSQHVVLNGRRFHYLSWGDSSAPPILFLHGGNQTAHTWDVVCAALSDNYYCIALDQRGHGDSEWSYEGDYTPRSQAEDVNALVEHLGWSRFLLAGMSMGCMNSLYYAAKHSARLAGVVAIDAGPWINVQGASRIREFVNGNVEHASFDDFVNAAIQFNPRRKEAFLRHSLQRSVRQLANGKWTWKSDRRDALKFEDMKRWVDSLKDIVPAISCPVLVVKGAESDVFSEENARQFVAVLPDASLAIVPNAGHTVQGDNPAGLLGEIQAFCEKLGYIS